VRAFARFLPAGALALASLACGANPAAPTGQREVLLHGDFTGLLALPLSPDYGHSMAALRFTTTAPGTIDVYVTWAYADNEMSSAIFAGDCTVDDSGVGGSGCRSLAGTAGVVRPHRYTIENVSAGTYVLAILNLGPGLESGSYEVGLTR
jgi:hypothetical protein